MATEKELYEDFYGHIPLRYKLLVAVVVAAWIAMFYGIVRP